jgi:hypothetical protein
MDNLEEPPPPELFSLIEKDKNEFSFDFNDLSIRLKNHYIGNNISIYDINGNILMNLKIDNNLMIIDQSKFLTGLYFYQIYDNENINIERGKFLVH